MFLLFHAAAAAPGNHSTFLPGLRVGEMCQGRWVPCRAWLPQELPTKDAPWAEVSFPVPPRHEECLGLCAQCREERLLCALTSGKPLGCLVFSSCPVWLGTIPLHIPCIAFSLCASAGGHSCAQPGVGSHPAAQEKCSPTALPPWVFFFH